MAADFAGRGNDLIDFMCRQIFPRPPFGIGRLLGGLLDRK
jgi:hypothetical protein